MRISELYEMKITPEKVANALRPSGGEDLDEASILLGISKEQLIKWLNLHTEKLNQYDCGRNFHIDEDGVKIWTLQDDEHRDGDEPAVIWPSGAMVWKRYNQYHRDGDEPAVINHDGSQSWYKRGSLHRDGDEPAVIRTVPTRDGRPSKEWWVKGVKVKVES